MTIKTGSTDVAFDYIVSVRNQGASNIFEIVRLVMNLLAYHLHDVSTEDSAEALAALAYQVQDQRLQDRPHNACNLREVLEGNLKAKLPFNTELNFQHQPLGAQMDTVRVYDRLELSRDPLHVSHTVLSLNSLVDIFLS